MVVGVLVVLAVIFVLGLGVGLFFGPVPGLTVFSVALLAAGVYHIGNLFKLVKWARQPVGTPLPRAVGLWDFVYADLNRLIRQAQDQRAKLTAALARFREASQAMPHGMMFLTDTNFIEFANRQAELHFGIDNARDKGAPVINLVRQPDFVRYMNEGRFDEPLTFSQFRPQSRNLMVHVVPFGEGMRLLMSEDITQGERLETMRRDFVANVSHEMRTPLTVVRGFLETVLDGLDDLDKDDIRHYLAMAGEQAGRMGRLIEDLLALSALETGAPMPHEEPVDIARMLKDVEQEARAVSAERHSIVVDPPAPGTERILGNSKELHSAFANLAVNAVRYTPAGGHIHIAWRLRGAVVEYSVEDDGIGIAPEHIPRLTERFYRVDRGRSRETGGTGLGLAIVKHVLSRHQADLHIDSEPGRGSRFSACFPARRLAAAE
ncbi:MAG TPA: phosphate regulon sensor histidine kinase PhoR [Rhodocyclaceae bacterium]|nr:phosphate regulon sensor histidine kinase PhoR [Rhodocyclaceae bacterium]